VDRQGNIGSEKQKSTASRVEVGKKQIGSDKKRSSSQKREGRRGGYVGRNGVRRDRERGMSSEGKRGPDREDKKWRMPEGHIPIERKRKGQPKEGKNKKEKNGGRMCTKSVRPSCSKEYRKFGRI